MHSALCMNYVVSNQNYKIGSWRPLSKTVYCQYLSEMHEFGLRFNKQSGKYAVH